MMCRNPIHDVVLVTYFLSLQICSSVVFGARQVRSYMLNQHVHIPLSFCITNCLPVHQMLVKSNYKYLVGQFDLAKSATSYKLCPYSTIVIKWKKVVHEYKWMQWLYEICAGRITGIANFHVLSRKSHHLQISWCKNCLNLSFGH